MRYIVTPDKAELNCADPIKGSESEIRELNKHLVVSSNSHYSRLASPIILNSKKYPVGSIVSNQFTSRLTRYYFTSLKRFQDIATISTLQSQLEIILKLHPQSASTYVNKSSLSLVQHANQSPLRVLESRLRQTNDFLDIFFERISDGSATAEIDACFYHQEEYLKRISTTKGRAPLRILTQEHIEQAISSQLSDVLPKISTLLSTSPDIAEYVFEHVGGAGRYYETYSPRIEEAIINHNIPPEASDSAHPNDLFPSSSFLKNIKTHLERKGSTTVDKRFAINNIKRVMKKLCSYYVFREVAELISLKADNPKLHIATKYKNPYNNDIIISICIMGIAKLGDLKKFLNQCLSRASNIGINILHQRNLTDRELNLLSEATCIKGLNSGTPVYCQILDRLGCDGKLLTNYTTHKTDEGIAARAAITGAHKGDDFILAVCANEVFQKAPDRYLVRTATNCVSGKVSGPRGFERGSTTMALANLFKDSLSSSPPNNAGVIATV
ncbi:MAG: hypothetical protein VXW87_00245 [Pseudomonadota bacterium]|nr:hypothetical protein [Pseudomonadota bacterium]